MSYSHRVPAYAGAAANLIPAAAKLRQVTPVRLRATPPAMPATVPASVRPKALMRRYTTMWLTPEGRIEETTRIAPATAFFEEAFSALARGSVLQTPEGRTAIEDIVPGMQVITAEGQARTVTWVGSMVVYSGAVTEGLDPVDLTRFTADAMGHGRPMQDLILGSRARILLRDARCLPIAQSATAYVPARCFRDGVSVFEVTPATPVTVYHLVLETQGTVRANGIEIESYHPGESVEAMMEPRMLSLFKDLFPQMTSLGDFGAMAHPRLTKFEVEQLLG